MFQNYLLNFGLQLISMVFAVPHLVPNRSEGMLSHFKLHSRYLKKFDKVIKAAQEQSRLQSESAKPADTRETQLNLSQPFWSN